MVGGLPKVKYADRKMPAWISDPAQLLWNHKQSWNKFLQFEIVSFTCAYGHINLSNKSDEIFQELI